MRYCSEVGRPSRQKTPSSTSVVTRLHEDELQQLAELTSFWGTGSRSETVRRALREATARTRGLLADQAALAHHLGRHGHRHHKAEVSDEAHAEALKLYVEQHWSGVQFADFLGVKQITAHMFLSGKRRKHIPRPEGFQYPWPDAASMNRRVGGRHGCATLTEEQVVDLLERVTAGEFSSVKEIQETFSISRGIA